jgi:tetratricopeptide (TPR) repeat protein
MRKGFIAFIILVFALGLAGCWGKSNNNANTAENTGPKETPLPEFTDANEALAVGTKLFDDGKTEMAIEAFQQAVKLNPDLAEAYFKMGIAYALIESREKNTAAPMQIGETEEDTNTNAKGEKKEPKTNSEKAFAKAVAAYKKMIDQNPKDDVAFYNMGRAYNKLNEDEDAEKALRQAVKLKPDDTEYQTELGAILIKLAQYGEAVGALKKAVELDAENIRAQELLEDAEAGVRRVDYVGPKKDEQKKLSNSNVNTSASPSAEGTPGPGQVPPPTPVKEVKPQPTPVKTPPPAKPKPH